MSYMDLFKQDPLAPASTIKEKPLPQMRRNAPLVKFPKEDSLAKKGMQLVSDEAMKQGMEGAKSYFTDAEGNMSLSNLKEDYAGAKDYLSNFFSPTDPTAGTASSLANQAAMTEAAGLTAAETAAGAGSQLATKAAGDVAIGKLGEKAFTDAALNAIAPASGAVTSGATTSALATAGPYVAAGLLADELLGLGIRESILGFNQGGKAKGPLYAAEGKTAYPSYRGSYNEMTDEELSKMLKSMSSKEREEYIKTIGLEEAMDAMYQSSGNKIKKDPLYAGMGMLALAKKAKEKEMMPGMLGVAQQFLSEGDLVGPLALRKIKYKQDGGKVEVEATMGD